MLNETWFILWGLLWAVYFMLDGYDLGVGTLLPFLGKSDIDRRIMYNSVGPFWDGNEVWLISAGGVTFAAFPDTYAIMFSTMYSALMIVLFALIIRGVSFEFRSKIESPGWKKIWDGCLFVGSSVPAVLFGVAFANIFQGIPFDQTGVLHGNLLTFLNPYGLLGGIFFLLMFVVHGSLWVSIKSQGDLSERAVRTAIRLWPVLLGFGSSFLAASAFMTTLWDNYLKYPLLFIIPLLAVGGLVGVRVFAEKSVWKAWISSSVMIVFSTFFGVAGLFPNMYPSSLNPAFSKTIYNSASSPLTLKIMLGVALVFVPIVIVYQTLIHRFFIFKITEKDLKPEESY